MHDPRISEIFYYFEKNTDIQSGRTMGRKIGVVQEILVKKHLLRSETLADSIVYEPRVTGKSGATHKVEFVFFQPLHVVEIPAGPWVKLANRLDIQVQSVDPANGRARLLVKSGGVASRITVGIGESLSNKELREHLFASGLMLHVSSVSLTHVRIALLDYRVPLASIESKRVGAQRFSGSDKLGSGIQTIEKAKQASLVSIDFDLQYNGKKVLPLVGRTTERKFRSIVVLGNGVHWTPNDRRVLETYVDYTYLAEDAAIIRYAEYVRKKAEKAGADFKEYFMEYFYGMTKTPPDSFVVTNDDFRVIVPDNSPPLVNAVEQQIAPYDVTKIP